MKNSFVYIASHVKIIVAKTTTIAVDSIEEMANEHIATTKYASLKSTNIVLFSFYFSVFLAFSRIFACFFISNGDKSKLGIVK